MGATSVTRKSTLNYLFENMLQEVKVQ